MKRILFASFTVLLWSACLAAIVLVWLEYLGGYESIGKWTKREKFELHHTKYYGRSFDTDPYHPYSVQHPHPFYIFGLPWTAEGAARIKSDLVSLNQYGFRTSQHNNAPAKAVLLGGSAAFGSHATGDKTTIASDLNRLQSQYDFYNFAVPSWNSHQEMVALAKAPFDVRYVVAFSGSNDFIVAFRYCQMGYRFPPGTPESFEHLAAISGTLPDQGDKGFIARLFPQTHEKISNLFAGKSKRRTVRPECEQRTLDAADAFIANQRVTRDLAQARGAKYLLALQPHIEFIRKPANQPQLRAAELREIFYKRVMDSEFCRSARCIDLSRTFASANPLLFEDARETPEKAIFADRVHLTDKGYAAVSEILAAEIAK
jgi:lysophospholipase L1-like esterase